MHTTADKDHRQDSKASAHTPAVTNRQPQVVVVAQNAVQPKMQEIADNSPRVQNALPGIVQRAENKTGMPDRLKSGIESLSGIDMSDTRVHFNSTKPSQLQAHAYAQGTDIHLASGQEKHLPHEAWHVVQQKQGRVKPTMQHKQVPINDNKQLETEADVMGGKALQLAAANNIPAPLAQVKTESETVQRLTGYEVETNIPIYGPHNDAASGLTDLGQNAFTNEIGHFLTGGLKYGLNYGEDPEGRFQISSDHNELQRLHRAIVDKLLILGLLNEGWKHRSMANIEYITPPRDEMSPGSISEHEADIAAVKKHLNSSLGVATSNNRAAVPAPAHNVFTGIPMGDLHNWLDANGIDRNFVQPDINAFASACNNQVYIQETSGVLPEDIPLVYEKAIDAMTGTEAPAKSTQIMAELMGKSIAIGAEAFTIDEELPEAYQQHKKAVVGFLTLVSSYILADNLSFLKFYSQSKSTSKNLLPFLSKTKLHEALGALPAEVKPDVMKDDDPWMAFTIKLEELASGFDAAYWSVKYEMEIDLTKAKGSVFPDGASNEMLNLISDSVMNVAAATGRPLALDSPNAEVERLTGQKGIPLEDRYFGQKYSESLDAENMGKALSDRFKFAAALHLGHIPEEEDQRKNAADIIGTPLSNLQKVAALDKLISERIESYKKLHNQLNQLGLAGDAEDTDDWLLDIGLALIADTPEEQLAGLQLVNTRVLAALTTLNEIKNKAVNANKDEDGEIILTAAVERATKDLDADFATPLIAFNKKNLKAEDLQKEPDQVRMTELIAAIEKTKSLYNLAKRTKLNVLTKDSQSLERHNAIKLLRNAITRVKREIHAAETFYNEAEKKIMEMV